MESRFTFMDTFRWFVFDFGMEMPYEPPFFSDFDYVRELFTQKALPKGRTVIIAPYANSAKMLPPWFWEKLTRSLSQMGYKVCVNINSKTEINPFTDIEEISFSYKESVAVLEYAGFFIALRSGLCDIVSSAKCKKIILYPEPAAVFDYLTHRCDMEFSSLRRMGLSDDAIEIESPLIQDWKNFEDAGADLDFAHKHYNALIGRILAEFEPGSEDGREYAGV
jgi:hypothetical protein